MANRRRHSRGTNQFVADETDELSRLSVQHFYERSTGLHIRHVAADRADLYLFPALHRAARSSDDLCLCEHLDGYGGVDAIFHHLLARDDGLLDSRNFDNRFHRLLVRILLRRPNVSDRHHAQHGAGRDEMAAVLLRIVLPRRDFPRPTTRRSTRGSAGNSNRLALPHLGRCARDVETRPRPLSSRRRISRRVPRSRAFSPVMSSEVETSLDRVSMRIGSAVRQRITESEGTGTDPNEAGTPSPCFRRFVV